MVTTPAGVILRTRNPPNTYTVPDTSTHIANESAVASVETTLEGVILRTLVPPDTYMFPETSNATPVGFSKLASVPTPLTSELVPLPA